MTPKQLKLLRQLSEIGEVTFINRSKENIVKAFEKLDIISLNRILDEKLTYQDVAKKVFLDKVNELFIELKEKDPILISHNGFCNSKECPNFEKNGVMFCGTNSGKHFNFIFEQDKTEKVTDIFQCHSFKCQSKDVVNENKKELFLKIYDDDRLNFVATSDYLNKNTYSLNAISELISTENCEIAKDEIVGWINRHKEFFDTLDWTSYNYKNESKFYDCYSHIRKINNFFILEEACFNALQIYHNYDMSIEIQLLKWLVDYEDLHKKLMLLHPNIVNEKELKSGKINLFNNLNRYIKLDYLKCCIEVENIFDTLYYDKLNKYLIDKKDMAEVSPFDNEFDDYISLGYHLEKRNLFVDKINYIPLPGLNNFLYNASSFTEMKEGVN